MRYLVIIALTLALANCVNATPPDANEAQLGVYIVSVASADDVAVIQADILTAGGELLSEFRHTLFGFAARMPPELAEDLANDARVVSIESDQPVFTMGNQADPPAHLDELDSSYVIDMDYTWTSDGTDVRIYVLDTGIRSSHGEFTGRVLPGFSSFAGGTTDICGHGTHVSGVAAGTTFGVAKGASIVPVKVANCGGSTLSVLEGLEWIATFGTTPAVINASIGVGASAAIDTAVRALLSRKFSVVAAVDCATGCSASLARISGVIGVTGFNRSGCVNCGIISCVDIYARGHEVMSAWNTSDSATFLRSGASFAAPIVSGAAARYLEANPTAAPATVLDYLHNVDDAGVCWSAYQPRIQVPSVL